MLIAIITGVILLGGLLGIIMSDVEQPDYKLIASKGNIEIRDYPPMILAEVEVSGGRKQAISQGFRVLADYIFGNNCSNKKMKTEGAAKNELSEKVAMTAPVLQEQDATKWKIRFVMPKKYTLQTLPKPNSKQVILVPLSPRRYAVIRFSGLANDQNIREYTEELKGYIVAEKLTPIGGSILAFYNPPWTMPFLRRNEVMIEIKP